MSRDELTPRGVQDGRWVTTEFGQTWVPGKAKKRTTPEGNLKKRCYAALTRWAAEHPEMPVKMVRVSVGHFDSPDGKHYALGTVGAGDFMIGINRTCIMVETKSATGRQSDGQKRMQAGWEATGNMYLVVREPQELIDALDDQIAGRRGLIF